MSDRCESCGFVIGSGGRGALDFFLLSASDIQRFQVANRLGISEESVEDAALCSDCAAAAVQWANVD